MPENQTTSEPSGNSATNFEQLADEQQLSLGREFWLFIVENKAWWMIPILIVLALIGILIALSATGATPFIYSIF
ncbi:MAG: hypothetical protein KDA93_08035 [Planctomycetaceae bacterium]|nr:hypothetical protein [Planctomycetaceae bacterium]